MGKRGIKRRPRMLSITILLSSLLSWMQLVEGTCMPRGGCSQALAYYTVVEGDTLNQLIIRFQTSMDEVQKYNSVSNLDFILNGDVLYFPFPCECQGDLLGYSFLYAVQLDDTVASIANVDYEGLTQVAWIDQANALQNEYIFQGLTIKVPVNCSCGNSAISPDYGLFTSYPAVSTDNLSSLADNFGISQTLLKQYNPSANWGGNLLGNIIFIPSKEAQTGAYPPYNASDGGSSGTNQGVIVGASVGGGVALLLILLLLFCLFCVYCPRKRARDGHQLQSGHGFSGEIKSGMLKFVSSRAGLSGRGGSGHGDPSILPDFKVDKSVEFSFEELAAGTNNFNAANKIGEGGYGSVYFANLRGQKLAVKRMNLQATREFLAELQVLTHVHHTNLVQLIGYCTVDSLFLIYEYVENGTLDRHLHGSHNLPPLSWSARIQIALDAARGLEYIHEHTKPTYIHRDVKSSNILIDKQFHAKVADFGLTKLTETGIGNNSLNRQTRLVGTFGYMSPEYARFGDVSPKVDVYSFGVVLFEIISAKEAIVRSAAVSTDSRSPHKEEQKGLVTLFDEVLKDFEGREKLQRIVDPALGDNYPLEAAWKMAQLAGACTQESPELRPSMRTVVVALMTLSSTTQEWEMSAYGGMAGLMSGR